MNKDLRRAFECAVLAGLREIVTADLRVKAKANVLELAEAGAKAMQARISLVHLARVDAVYLLAEVFGGRLCDMLYRMSLPPKRNNLMAKGVFLLSSLSEKNKEFSPDRGGARVLHGDMPVAEAAADVVGRIRSIYVPIAQSILGLTPDLAKHVVARPDCFSYPLTILAVLEKLGISSTYSEIAGIRAAAKAFKKESGLKIRELIDAAVF